MHDVAVEQVTGDRARQDRCGASAKRLDDAAEDQDGQGSLASVLPLQPFASLAVILTAGSALALMVFLPVALRQPQAEMAAESGRDAAKR
jgi:hypothetical protein